MRNSINGWTVGYLMDIFLYAILDIDLLILAMVEQTFAAELRVRDNTQKEALAIYHVS
jgi:hypothetical protein